MVHIPLSIRTHREETIQGAKGNTIDAGTHVPLIISWPKEIKEGYVYSDLIEFNDFFPTFAEIVGKETPSDGQSFYPQLKGSKHKKTGNRFLFTMTLNGVKNVNRYRNQFARTTNYKLYQDGKFFNLENDKLEKTPLHRDSLQESELIIKSVFGERIAKNTPLGNRNLL